LGFDVEEIVPIHCSEEGFGLGPTVLGGGVPTVGGVGVPVVPVLPVVPVVPPVVPVVAPVVPGMPPVVPVVPPVVPVVPPVVPVVAPPAPVVMVPEEPFPELAPQPRTNHATETMRMWSAKLPRDGCIRSSCVRACARRDVRQRRRVVLFLSVILGTKSYVPGTGALRGKPSKGRRLHGIGAP
jgi:hypothetical protein